MRQKPISHHIKRSSLIVAVILAACIVVGLPALAVGIGVGVALASVVARSHMAWLGAVVAVAVVIGVLALGLAGNTVNALWLAPFGFAVGVVGVLVKGAMTK